MLLDEDDLRSALHRAASGVRVPVAPVEEVSARGRRRRHRRGAGLAGASVLAGACAAGVVLGGGLGPSTTTSPLPPGVSAPAAGAETPATRDWAPLPITPSARGLNGVEVTAPGYATATEDTSCAVAGTVTVVPVQRWTAGYGCDGGERGPLTGPAALVLAEQSGGWQFGGGAGSELRLVDGVAVHVDTVVAGEQGRTVVHVPTRGVQVWLEGNEEQVRELLDSLTVAPLPGEREVGVRRDRAAVPAFGQVSSNDLGRRTGVTFDRELLTRLVEVVDAAEPVQGDPGCVPEPLQLAELDLRTTWGDIDPAKHPERQYTGIAFDLSGRCDVLFSNTGAVVRPDPAAFGELVAELNTRDGFRDGNS